MKNAKRIIALLLAVVMMIGILPFATAANVGPFTDVKEDEWFAEYVAYVYEYGLMNGTSKTTFSPNDTCTRAMAATVLYRIEGEPAVAEPATFTDLKDDWYLDPVAWAEDEGVVNGVGNGKFDPDGLVTREQLVTMIWRYAGSPEPTVDGGIDNFPDAKSVSDYAVKAFNWAIAKGIIDGKDHKLVPAGNATRAEFAKIISVYDKTNEPCETHTWVDGEVIKEATCTEAGEMATICSVCGEKGTKEIPALGHDYVDGICSRCGEKVVDVEEGSAIIYYTNDVHTYIDKDLSYDNIADLKAQTKALGIDTLLVDAGGHIQGTAFGGMDKGQHIIEFMNAAGYDYATLGNHEFDYGMEGRINVTDKWADFPYLSANFYREENGVRGENVLDSYAIVELAGKKVAIIGITTPESFTKSTPAYFQDENGNYIYGIAGGDDGAALYADVQTAIDAAKAEGAEIIIALGHLGDDVASKPWTSEEVIANTTGLNAFIDGHSHSTVAGKEVADKSGNKVLLTQTGEYFGAIGKMTIAADGTISTELITSYNGSDASVKADVDAWIAEVDTLLGTVIAKSEVDFIIKDETGRLIRKQETNLGDFCADALYYLFDNMDMDVDVAIMNGGGIRADMPAGDISYKTTKTVHTFGNVACLQTITGQQLLDALEWGAKDVGVGENGGFLHVSGITYEIHSYIPSTVQKDDKGVWCGAPTGEYRVKNVMVGGEPLDVNASYNLAGYNYTLRDLGDGFAMFDGAVNVLDYVMEDYLVLANYAQSFRPTGIFTVTNSEGVEEEVELPIIKADNSVLGANYSDKTHGDGRIVIKTEKDEEETYVAIFNPAKGKVMTTDSSVYNNKDQMVSADATLNAEGKLQTAATNVALFNIKTNDAGITTFTTKDGKYLYCDGTNVRIVEEAGEFTEFVLDEAEGGSYIRLANYLHEGKYAQYLEFYANVFTCFGMTATSDTGAYIFNFLEVVEGGSSADKYTLTSELKDGDQVIMYNAGSGKALSSNMNGYNAAGVDVVPENNVITTGDISLVWTATKNADGTFTFTQGSKKMMTAVDGTYTNIYFEGDYADTWNVKTANAAKDSFYIYSATEQGSYGDIYIEWYEKKAGFTAYSTSNPNEANFGIQFYAIDGDGGSGGDHSEMAVFEKVTSDLGNWEGTYVIGWDDGTNAYIFDGQNDAAHNNTQVAIVDGKVTVSSTHSIIIEAVEGGYTLKATAGYLNGALKNGEVGNELAFEADPAVATIVWTDGNPIITATAFGTIFRFNNNSYDGAEPSNWFRFFKPTSSVQTPVNLYKLTNGEVIPPVPPCEHVWDDGVETIEPECETTGLCVFTCTLCGETKEVVLEALGHIDEDADNLCDDCGKEMPKPVEGGYVKVTEAPADWSGEYLLVYEEGSLAFDGSLTILDTKVACLDVAIVDGVIAGDYSANVITIAPMGDGTYSIQAASGKYFAHTSATNTLDSEDEPAALTLAIEDGNAIITAEDGYILRFNSSADQMRFRFYKSTSSVKTPVALYKFSGETGTTPPPCNHEWNEGEVTAAATCTEDGVMTFTCGLCSATKTEAIAALGHDYVDGICANCGKEEADGFALAAEIKDGDQVIIYNATNAKALTSTPSGYYFAGADVTLENDTIVTDDASLIWTVIKNEDGSYSFKQGDNALGIVVSGTYFNLKMEGNDTGWILETCNAENHSFYVYSSTLTGQYGNVYLEWYANKSAFSAYCTGADRINEKDFGFQFYVSGATGTCAHVWDEGEVTLEPTCQADGEKTYNCTKCDEVKNEIIPALACSDADGDNKCDSCGATMGGALTEIDFADLADGDTIMIVMHTSPEKTDKDFVLMNYVGKDSTDKDIYGYAVEFDGETHDETMYWTVSIVDGVMKLYANGTSNHLYSTNSNNGLRIGKDEGGVIAYDAEYGYLTITDTEGNVRYLGVYDGGAAPNFRAYKMGSSFPTNIKDQTLTIYKIG